MAFELGRDPNAEKGRTIQAESLPLVALVEAQLANLLITSGSAPAWDRAE